ncbi:uncharacterized protein CANTADRAFT_3553 [Suhomyces tanzawaensis NRRL Y-17324]|uniref:SMP-LTD domain-containing protein n=1 Tax=Suhomyces tanzawaensis NRRL Y-17324 TaxID=984487 RepID=A0A1E4SPK4_9ASCO|nr:uncharacterized protein CANTADRAFT_3553 [Suhomyces tanzawaensis NRRL Y-17324]ODV81451.1 hypothetical protein CANTADRAFT_3553 [Suhomyces tanzawaensis NRRL Y-17324]
MELTQLLVAYFVGGITFFPLLIFTFIYLHPKISSDSNANTSSRKSPKTGVLNGDNLEYSEPLKAGEVEEKTQSGLDTFKTGWIFVTQEYLESPDDITSATQSISEAPENKSAYSSLYKLVQKDTVIIKNDCNGTKKSRSGSFDFPFSGFSSEDVASEPVVASTSSTSPSAATAASANQPNQPSDKIRNSQRKHRYYAILKHGNLFLYKDESLKDVKHVIVLSSHIVSLWPRGLSDGSLFTRSSAIAILKPSSETQPNKIQSPEAKFFIYCDYNIDKEDWYFALIRSTKQPAHNDFASSLDPEIHAKTLHFTTSHIMDLIQTLYSSEGQLQTKWLNALIGRLFLSFQKTKVLETYLYTKVAKKLNKIKKPGFLDKFVINSIYPGDSAPFFTYPSLKEINPDGTILVSTYMTYHGNFSIEIATKVNISLGARFKTRDVDLVLRITLSKLEGRMLIKLKPPPSGRLWYAFEVEPTMNLKIEPVISSRQMAYTIITNTIEKKFKEAVKESFVLPHWDDIVFYETTDEVYRGGIWEPPQGSEEQRETQPLASDLEEKTDLPSDIEEKIELSSQKSKSKLSNTITDFGKKLKNTRSNNGLNEAYLGEVESQSLGASTRNATMNTLKKIGKWYFKDEKASTEEKYTPPEMILSRRLPRKASNSSLESQKGHFSKQNPSYEFSRFASNTSLRDKVAEKSANLGFPVTPADQALESEMKVESLKSEPLKCETFNEDPLEVGHKRTSIPDTDDSSMNYAVASDIEDEALIVDFNEKIQNFASNTSLQNLAARSPTSSISGVAALGHEGRLTRKPPPPID